ncbi:MFS transporter [Marininema halotolerans]|uniref:Lysosomal dipeptide transporter MFSD1 n=1 Tax=Marininema halotolerans TaxID=1155944 RepID=A0A1I6QMU7_9BACL|nr:MFS transporter [Marininema halotolerans]SFS53662.1 Sugar phosphate permease [Marininema halotolerans]
MHNPGAFNFNRVRWTIFTLLTLSFILGFFHRFAPAAFAEAVRGEFHISAAALGTLASMHFYTYTAMQIPSGILIDRFGARLNVSIGAIIAGLGSILFGLAPSFAIASLGPFIVGLGVSTIFVGIMKSNSLWFRENQYGWISGITMLLGNLGSVLAAQPLAMLLEWFSWRSIFVTAGALSVVLSLLTYLFVRNSPQEAGFQPGSQYIQSQRDLPKKPWIHDLQRVIHNKNIWFTLGAGIGTNSTFYAFAGLWGIPLLRDGFHLSNNHASFYTTLALATYGLASLGIGWFSDKLGVRKPMIILGNLLSFVGWIGLALLPWTPGWSGLFLYLLVGASASQIVITFAVVKEVVSPSISGMSLAFLNAGIFLGVALLQSVFGWIMDISNAGNVIHGATQYVLHDYIGGLLLFAAISFVGILSSLTVTETHCQSLTEEKVL